MKEVEFDTDHTKWYLSDPNMPMHWWKQTVDGWSVVDMDGNTVVEGKDPEECILKLMRDASKT